MLNFRKMKFVGVCLLSTVFTIITGKKSYPSNHVLNQIYSLVKYGVREL